MDNFLLCTELFVWRMWDSTTHRTLTYITYIIYSYYFGPMVLAFVEDTHDTVF